jgi:hypothetical protein
VPQPAAVMWHERAVTPVSAIIVAEDVGATMVVAAVSEAAGLPHGSAAVAAWYMTIIIGWVAAARAWSGGSMQRRYL